jgi:hypothetical protein
MISEGLLLPAVVFGVTALMAPALYTGPAWPSRWPVPLRWVPFSGFPQARRA